MHDNENSEGMWVL